jgi:hypothetical protein
MPEHTLPRTQAPQQAIQSIAFRWVFDIVCSVQKDFFKVKDDYPEMNSIAIWAAHEIRVRPALADSADPTCEH